MKKRWMFLLLLVAGALLLAGHIPVHIDVRPFPASNATVRLELPVRFAGDYQITLSMPKVDKKLTLDEEVFPCDFLVSIEADGHPVLSRHVTSMRTASEYGFANTQSFVAGENLHLGHGTYDVSVTGGSACPVATSRGASVTIEKFQREHILGTLLTWVLAIVLILVGLIGLMFSEFVRR
jgi:hypothetical protein